MFSHQHFGFTDEATFINCGQVNWRNMHYWSVENPRRLRHINKQRPWSLNVWCGIVQSITNTIVQNQLLSILSIEH